MVGSLAALSGCWLQLFPPNAYQPAGFLHPGDWNLPHAAQCYSEDRGGRSEPHTRARWGPGGLASGPVSWHRAKPFHTPLYLLCRPAGSALGVPKGPSPLSPQWPWRWSMWSVHGGVGCWGEGAAESWGSFDLGALQSPLDTSISASWGLCTLGHLKGLGGARPRP
jgi:hypothetical protein